MIKSTEVFNLTSKETLGLYKKFVNPQQAKLFAGLSTMESIALEAEGINITLQNGKKIKDFTGGLGVLNHGHNHPEILKARIQFQKNKHMEVSKLYLSPHVAALSKNLAEIFPGDLEMSYFCNSGAEAIEGALKLCHKSFNAKRNIVISSDRSFHGKTLGALSISNADEITYPFPRLLTNEVFKFDDYSSVERIVKNNLNNDGTSNIFAIIIEPFSASSFTFTSSEFLKKIKELAKEFSIPIIFDEIYTGFYKTGPLFNFMRTSVIPDIVVYSKSFGGGKSSISGYTSTSKLFNKSYGNTSDALMHSTTYNGFGEETYTALVALEVALAENFEKRAKDIGSTFEDGLTNLKSKNSTLKDFEGMGTLYGLEFDISKSFKTIEKSLNTNNLKFINKVHVGSIIDELYREHNILTYFTDNKRVCLAVSPSNIATIDDVKYFIETLDNVLSQNQTKLILKFVKNVSLENIKLLFI